MLFFYCSSNILTGSMPENIMTDAPIFIRSLCGFHWHSERVCYVLCLFGVFGKNMEHTGSIRAVRKNVLKEYWKRSESICHHLGPFGVFVKHTDPSASKLPKTIKTRRMLPERFQNVHRMISLVYI